MKKLYVILSLIVVSFLMVFAADTVKMLRIYHHGTFTAVPLPNIDSIDHSKMDADSVLHTDYQTAVIKTIGSDYSIPFETIDSVIICDLDFDAYRNIVGSIKYHIFAEEQEETVESYQERLLAWLGDCEGVDTVTINDQRDLITVKLDNGLPFLISFWDMSFFGSDVEADDNSEAYARPFKVSSSEPMAYDVTHEDDEHIILKKTDVLYIEGMNMLSSNADEEYSILESAASASPVNCNVERVKKSMDFFKKDFSNYGIVIISQTHGTKFYPGGFCMEHYYFRLIVDLVESSKLETLESGEKKSVAIPAGVTLYTKLGKMYWDFSNHDYGFRMSPEIIANKLSHNSEAIVYGNYCWSYDMRRYFRNTVVGYDGWSRYLDNYGKHDNINYCTEWTKKMLNGYTVSDAMENLVTYRFFNPSTLSIVTCTPRTNRENSKQRFFSIETNDITSFNKSGCPVITGKVYGYDNLDKKRCQYKLFVRKGNSAFTPADDDVTDYYTHNLSIDDEGRLECPYTAEMDVNTPYTFMFAIKYKEYIYYSTPKTYDNALCPDDNHPHLIDLGLPSGTKWACCNVGAHSPEEPGKYLAWGETGEKTEYTWENYEYADKNDKNHALPCIDIGADISGTQYDAAYVTYGGTQVMPSLNEAQELEEYCWNPSTTYKGMGGYIFIGPSGNKIFMPFSGYKMKDKTDDYDHSGYIWLSEAGKYDYPIYAALMRYTHFSGVGFGKSSLRYVGHPIRGISKK